MTRRDLPVEYLLAADLIDAENWLRDRWRDIENWFRRMRKVRALA